MTNKFILPMAFLTVALFALGIFLEVNNLIPRKNHNYKFVKEYSSVNSIVEKSSKDHGFILLNDSIMVWGGNKPISSSSKNKLSHLENRMSKIFGDDSRSWGIVFESVSPPYRIIKYPNDSVFQVVQDSDTF